jgi:hypothetical protein
VRKSLLLLVGCFAFFAADTSAPASTTLLTSPLLWATVDVCQSASSGSVVGLRASMPGTGDASEQMYMSFRLQYQGPQGGWHNLSGADSGLIDAGSSGFRSRQAGLDFQLAPSAASQSVLRGRVIFQWRIGTTVVHRARLTTTAGHHPSAGATPPGYSAALCQVS